MSICNSAKKITNSSKKIALISMPWSSINGPNMAIGLLQASFSQQGTHCDSFHLSDEFYRAIEKIHDKDIDDLIFDIVTSKNNLLYDWLFAEEAFGVKKEIKTTELMHSIKNEFKDLIKIIASGTNWSEYDIIGFTCTLNQLVSSLAMSKHIKKYHHDVKIILGGFIFDENCANEIVKNCDWIDHVFVGECDYDIEHILSKIDKEKVSKINNLAKDLSLLPLPNYDDFYNRRTSTYCCIESSRGCYYGDKTLCKFCSMVPEASYRLDKNVQDKVSKLVKKYNIKYIEFADLILSPVTLKTIEDGLYNNLDFEYYLRVDTIKQIKLNVLNKLKKNGTSRIFIGIESLSQNILDILDKGHKAIDSISVLKWAKYYNIKITWYLLTNIPECPQIYYDDMIPLIQKIQHFDPPVCQALIIAKGSPYYNKFKSKAHPAYKNIFPECFDLDKVAWEFTHENETKQYKILDLCEEWRTKSNQNSLSLIGNTVYKQYGSNLEKIIVSKEEKQIIDYCYIPQNDVINKFNIQNINRLLECNILININGKHLSVVEPNSDECFNAC